MRDFLFQLTLRLRLAWAALRGRQALGYLTLLRNRPLAYNVKVLGTLEAGPGAYVHGCVVENTTPSGDGIRVGPGSCVFGCVVSGFHVGFCLDGDEPESDEFDWDFER